MIETGLNAIKLNKLSHAEEKLNLENRLLEKAANSYLDLLTNHSTSLLKSNYYIIIWRYD